MSASERLESYGSPRGFGRAASFVAAVVVGLLLGSPIAADGPPKSIAERLADADEVIVADVLGESDDHRRLKVRVTESVHGRLCVGSHIDLPHPRLATFEGFVRFRAGNRYAFLLFRGVDDAWRPLELGETATFPVEDGAVILADAGRSDATLPSGRVVLPVETFIRLAAICGGDDQAACQRATAEALESKPKE